MDNYPVKILVAFGEAVDRNLEIHRWLTRNGYAELGALAACLQGDQEAEEWLKTHKFHHFLAFHYAVYDDSDARKWLAVYRFHNLARLSDAVNGYKPAMEYFRKKKLNVYIRLAIKIKQIKDQVIFDANDYHKFNI
jgi:hypothetical protein